MTTSSPADGVELDASEERDDERQRRRITRRGLFVAGSTLGIGSLATYLFRGRAADPSSPSGDPSGSPTTTSRVQGTIAVDARPSSPRPSSNWSSVYGAVEGDVVIDAEIVLDVDARVTSLVIAPTGRLVMAPDSSITLTSTGNVEVGGFLVMQPRSADRVHRVHFEAVDESMFQGGGMEILSSDVGLWITDDGVLEAIGSPKTSWTRARDGCSAGSNKVTVGDATGWRVGDLITIAPTGAPTPDDGRFHQSSDGSHEYDDAAISAIDGNELTLGRSLAHDHPMVSFTQWDGTSRTYGAEVLNLTRNVIVSGTESGRAHVLFLHCRKPQNVADVQFDHLGPRQSSGRRDAGVGGRYPLHMHHCGDGSRGSVIKGCLVTRSGNRAFVPHESHGVTLDGCVAHDVHGTAYWWDQPGRHNPTGEDPKTHDSLWTRCVASFVWAAPNSDNGYRLAGFNLSGGNHNSNALIDSVAVGVTSERVTMNNGANSGFHWTEHGQAVWVFEGCLAHNVAGDGILSWQNDEEVHLLTDFTAYHCGAHGIEHGAYSNFYSYSRLTLVGNRMSGIGCHAVTRRTGSVRRRWTDNGDQAPSLSFTDVRIDGMGITKDGVQGLSHKFASNEDGPTLMENFSISGTTRSGLFENEGKNAPYYVLKDWNAEGVDAVVFDDGAPTDTRVDVENVNGDGETYTMRP